MVRESTDQIAQISVLLFTVDVDHFLTWRFNHKIANHNFSRRHFYLLFYLLIFFISLLIYLFIYFGEIKSRHLCESCAQPIEMPILFSRKNNKRNRMLSAINLLSAIRAYISYLINMIQSLVTRYGAPDYKYYG